MAAANSWVVMATVRRRVNVCSQDTNRHQVWIGYEARGWGRHRVRARLKGRIEVTSRLRRRRLMSGRNNLCRQ